MTKRFDIRELLRVAVIEERSGITLYRKLSEKAEEPWLRELFTWLSDQERFHEERFQDLSDSLQEPEPGEQYPDEYVDYLEALAAGGGASDAHQRVEGVRSGRGAVDLAMGFERELLALQRDIGGLLGGRHQSIVDQVIQEERNHLVRLSGARKKLAG